MIPLILKIIFILLIFGLALMTLAIARKKPSNKRKWVTGQTHLPIVTDEGGGKIRIQNVRHNIYRTETDYDVQLSERVYDINTLQKVWFSVVHFHGYRFAAHTFFTFEFENDIFITISVEIRKQIGDSYSAVKGFFRQFDLMYVIADERDIVKLRTNHHKDNVFHYPLKLTKEQSQNLFLDILKRSEKLRLHPEFYHTFANACFQNLTLHLNSILPKKLPFDLRIILPENADKYLYGQNLIDTELSFPEARKKFQINETAQKFNDDIDFSKRIKGR